MTDEQDEMINESEDGGERICDDEFVDELVDEEDADEEELTEQFEDGERDVVSFEESVGFDVTMEAVVEAVLFASDEPLSAERLVNIVEAGSVKQIRVCIESLNKKYEEGGFSFRIEQIAGGYQMMTLSEFNYWLKKLVRVRADTKLSPAALETLAIIAYKQPVIRADIEAIRGVASGEVIRNLMFKGLVKMVGKAEVLGRPMLYGTTKKFLDVFGLGTLKDLPTAEELKRPEQ
jgi:segregation and condensation protein B